MMRARKEGEGELVSETTMTTSGLKKCKPDCYQLTKIIRVDIPDGSSYSPTSSKRQTSSNGGKATQSTSRPKGSSKGGRR